VRGAPIVTIIMRPPGVDYKRLYGIAINVLLPGVLLCMSHVYSADAGSTNNTTEPIRIGYFLQESQPPYRIGAIKLAIEKAKADGLLPDRDIR
jgi:hypothetical protein